MVIAKVWSLKHEFQGEPMLDDFIMTEEVLPSVRENEILLQALYLGIEPYYRLAPFSQGLPAEQVARVVESKAVDYPKGTLVIANVGWRTMTIVNISEPSGIKVELIEEVPDLSPSLWIGAIGISGVTAYLGFYERGNPKKGDIIVVSAAAGAVGSLVGQLAKLEGLVVIGLAGSKEKCDYILELGYDHAINYKGENISQVLDQVAPNGVDIYFDNVGGEISDIVYSKLRDRGRVVLVGQISAYNKPLDGKVTNWNMQILLKELKIEGFKYFSESNLKQFPRVRKALIKLFQEGKLKAKEHMTEGFENMPQAALDIFTGANFGKAVVRA